VAHETTGTIDLIAGHCSKFSNLSYSNYKYATALGQAEYLRQMGGRLQQMRLVAEISFIF
jgi:hypothetical protein